jgi:hypothetical protein
MTESQLLTPEQKSAAQKIFEGQEAGKHACSHCAGIHSTVAGTSADRQPCPRIKKVEYHPNGTMASVEYWSANSGWEINVVFPHDVYDDE